MKNRSIISVLLFAVLCSTPFNAAARTLPIHPKNIPFASLNWQVPGGEQYRTVLPNGIVAYIAEDHSLPLVKVSGYVACGNINDPAGKEGLYEIMAYLLRTGGTEKYPADSLDALIDLYALKARISVSETQMQFSFSCLSEYVPLCMDIMQQMLLHPAFEEKKVQKALDLYAEDISHQFDNPAPILRAACDKAMYSSQSNSRMITAKSLKSITRTDLYNLHKNLFTTSAVILSVAGDFNAESMRTKLTNIFPQNNAVPMKSSFPVIALKTPWQALIVPKTITQSYIRMSLPLFKRPDPDYYAVSILNMVLGGSGFTSRLTTKVRSDEGLTYSIHSNAESNYTFPGTWYIDFFTKTESTCRAISLILSEVQKLLAAGVTDEEISHAKSIMIDGFPSMFRSPEDIADNYAMNEYLGRSMNHYKEYPDKIRALNVQDIRDVAKKYLKPESFVYTVVGDTTELFKCDTVKGFSLRGLAPVRYVSPDSIPALP